MPRCVRCNGEVGILGLLSFNGLTGRCGGCEGEVRRALERFRGAFLQACADDVLTGDELRALSAGVTRERVPVGEALAFVRGDALRFLERVLAFAYADGVIEGHEERNIRHLLGALAIPEDLARPMLDRMAYLKYLSDIRRGDLPSVRASVHLDSDEVCHMEAEAVYHKAGARSVKQVPGRLLATSKSLHFIAPSGGLEIAWRRVLGVSRERSGVHLQLTAKRGSGRYDVPDPVLAEAVIETKVKMEKRLIVAAGGNRRHIPHHVKVAVWHRDQGKCVQCGACEYLEYDHIIPFSKGGANTEGNLQLLCRRCNLSKADRI